MRRTLAIALVSALSLPATSILAAPAGAQAQTVGTLSGTATNAASQPLANVIVQLRSLATGQLAGTTTSAVNGAFTFAGVPAGNFAVEVVNVAGHIIGTSAAVAVTTGATITGVTVSTSAILAGAAGAAGAAGTAAIAGGGAISGGMAATIVASAAGAGLAGVTIARERGDSDASPSR